MMAKLLYICQNWFKKPPIWLHPYNIFNGLLYAVAFCALV